MRTSGRAGKACAVWTRVSRKVYSLGARMPASFVSLCATMVDVRILMRIGLAKGGI